jgi:hypothetical protein
MFPIAEYASCLCLQAYLAWFLACHLAPLRFWLAACNGLTIGDLMMASAHVAIVAARIKAAPAAPQCAGPDADACLDRAALKRMDHTAKALGSIVAMQMALLMCHVPRSNILSTLLGSKQAILIRYHR